MKTAQRPILAAAVLGAALTLPAHAEYVYDGLVNTITELFDGLPTTTQTAFFSATVGVQASISGTQFVGTRIAGTGTTANLVAADGTSNAGAIYSHGTVGETERALGMIASGTQIMGFGFELRNTSAITITDLMVSFTQENWRSSTATQNVMPAFWGTTDSGVLAASFVSAATGMSAVTALDLTGPAPVAANGALNGNDPANQSGRSFLFSGVNIDPGESFFLRWTDVNDTGNDAGLAIDGMTVTIPEPGSIALLLGGTGLLGLRRRRA